MVVVLLPVRRPSQVMRCPYHLLVSLVASADLQLTVQLCQYGMESAVPLASMLPPLRLLVAADVKRSVAASEQRLNLCLIASQV